ncbi:hypothetical protein ABZ719_36135 [Streptomyces sp. NPDC006743]|uniref:hypothetical protein n=1 Tax=Streptomyces sp. NPDC006743 TaxID=3154480 RepID=UPI0034533F0E
MDVPPALTAAGEQHIADRRAALQRVLPLLSFYAGREAADSNPEQTAPLLGAATRWRTSRSAPPPSDGRA